MRLWKQLAMLMCLWCMVQAGAAEKDVPLYKHLADLAGNAKLVTTLPSLGNQHLYQVVLNCGRSSTNAFHCSIAMWHASRKGFVLPRLHLSCLFPGYSQHFALSAVLYLMHVCCQLPDDA